MEIVGNRTDLLIFVDIAVIKLDKAFYYFGKVDPCQVVLSYNIWSLSMTSKSQPPQMGEISSTIFHSLFSLEFTDLINYSFAYLFICLFAGSFGYFMIKYHEYYRTAIMHDYVIYQEPFKYQALVFTEE